MRTTVITIAVALALSFAAAPAVGQSAGASGQCFDDGTEGGNGAVGVDSDGNVDATDAEEAQSIAAALVAFATGQAEDDGGDACDSEDRHDHDGDGEYEHDHRDYLEVHAAGQQVCYDTEVRTDGSCPTSPSSPHHD